MRAKKYRRFDQAGSAGAFVDSTATGREQEEYPSGLFIVQARNSPYVSRPNTKPCKLGSSDTPGSSVGRSYRRKKRRRDESMLSVKKP